MLYREQTFAPRAFHSELQQQNKHSQHQGGWSTHRKARLEPATRDAQRLAQNVFPPWRGDHVNSVPDLAASLPLPSPPPPSSSKQKCYFAVRVAVIDFVRILRHLIYSLCIILIYMQLPEGFGMYMKTAYWRISSREVTKLIEYTIWIASSAPVCPLLHALKWQYPVAQKMNSAIDRINH